MCRAAVLPLALLAATSSAALAQASRAGATDPAVLLARAESLRAVLARQDSATQASAGVPRRAMRFDSGPLTVLLPGTAGDATGRRIAARAVALLDDMGAVPAAFVSSRVVVSSYATSADAVLRAAGLAGRIRLRTDAGQRPDTLTDDWQIATSIGAAYRATLDDEWTAWLPWNLGIGWKTGREDVAAVRELMAGQTRAGARCLAGEAAGCRLWLGLDRDANPYATRFTPPELRALMAVRYYYGGAAGLVRNCLSGSDEACVRAASRGDLLPPIPAGYSARASLLRAVRERHGAAALQRALADTAGSLGDRLARATGVGLDSLVSAWRTWVLTEGGRARVRADVREALPVVVFGGLLLFAAAWSGRWR